MWNINYELKQMAVIAAQYDGKDTTPIISLLGDACEIAKPSLETIVKVHCKGGNIKIMQQGDWAVMFPVADVDVMTDTMFKRLFEKERTMDFTFDKALDYLKRGHCVTRKVYAGIDKHLVICKQITADIKGVIVEKMQSLPTSAKDLLIKLPGTTEIHYRNQFLAINLDTRTATSWTPTGDDLLAEDWMLVR